MKQIPAHVIADLEREYLSKKKWADVPNPRTDREDLGGLSACSPHYERMFSGKYALIGNKYRQMLINGGFRFELDQSLLDMEHDGLRISSLPDSLLCGVEFPPEVLGVRNVWCSNYLGVLRCWHEQGAPLISLGPVMCNELLEFLNDDFHEGDFFKRLKSRLPFPFFYLALDGGCDGGFDASENVEGAYIFTSNHEDSPAVCILVDDGFTLDPFYIKRNQQGDTVVQEDCFGFFDEGRGVRPAKISAGKASYLALMLAGLIEYLQATNKETVDPTRAIRAAITSGKKSKVRKALNQMIGKRKIWIEPTLERKAREQGITGEKLTSGHVRRGHLHTYYTGAKLDADGLKIPNEKRNKVVKFVAPTWVGPRTITAEPREYGIRARR